jgi:hypothetical protein
MGRRAKVGHDKSLILVVCVAPSAGTTLMHHHCPSWVLVPVYQVLGDSIFRGAPPRPRLVRHYYSSRALWP